jgi:hypothetical protein
MAASESWTDPNRCPFCGRTVASPGEGFMNHLDESEACNEDFRVWRGRIAEDMSGGWTG